LSCPCTALAGKPSINSPGRCLSNSSSQPWGQPTSFNNPNSNPIIFLLATDAPVPITPIRVLFGDQRAAVVVRNQSLRLIQKSGNRPKASYGNNITILETHLTHSSKLFNHFQVQCLAFELPCHVRGYFFIV